MEKAKALTTQEFASTSGRARARKYGKHQLRAVCEARTDVAMTKKALCKVLCHNLVILIHEIHELGIEPVFQSQRVA